MQRNLWLQKGADQSLPGQWGMGGGAGGRVPQVGVEGGITKGQEEILWLTIDSFSLLWWRFYEWFHISELIKFTLNMYSLFYILICQKSCLGLPWWRSGWESVCQRRRHRFEPWSGKIPHAEEQLGPWATTTEPALLEPVLRNERPRQWKACAPRWRVAPTCHN